MPETQVVPEAPVAPVIAPTEPAAPATIGEQKPAEQAPADTEDSPEKRSNRFARRIDAANRRYGQEKARADLLAAENERLRPKPSVTQGAPTLEQHNFDPEAYATAKAEYVATERLKEHQSQQRQERTQGSLQRISQEWQMQAAEAEDTWDDFHEKVGELQPVNALSVAVMRAGPAVAYHLATHTEEARAIAGLEPVDQLVAVGELKARLKSSPPVAKQPSKAPAPITPVSGKAPAVSDEISEDDDMKTFIRKREKQLGRKK